MSESVGKAIVRAHQAVEQATRERNALISDALDNGATTRAIADLIGVSFNTVFRWGGGARGRSKAENVLAASASGVSPSEPSRGQR